MDLTDKVQEITEELSDIGKGKDYEIVYDEIAHKTYIARIADPARPDMGTGNAWDLSNPAHDRYLDDRCITIGQKGTNLEGQYKVPVIFNNKPGFFYFGVSPGTWESTLNLRTAIETLELGQQEFCDGSSFEDALQNYKSFMKKHYDLELLDKNTTEGVWATRRFHPSD